MQYPEQCSVVYTYNPTVENLRKDDLEFDANLGYIVCYRVAWATGQDCCPNKQLKDKEINKN